GDMFWWLTHGTPTGNMPGFGAQLDDDARWSLVNFLRAFADGHRARVLSPRVVPRQPWLGAPNFTYETAGGRGGELKDARGTHAMLLVLAGGAPAASRLATLAGQHAALRTNGLRVLVIPTTITCADVPAPLDCVTLGAVDTAFAYRLLARTLDAPGPRDALLPDVPHAEFLVDRFGFVRARWVPGADTEGWENPATLPAQARVLAREPQVLDSPDDHVH
ncbi:MAG: cytochrome c, partial [Gammaproteobacteria bacterium]